MLSATYLLITNFGKKCFNKDNEPTMEKIKILNPLNILKTTEEAQDCFVNSLKPIKWENTKKYNIKKTAIINIVGIFFNISFNFIY